MYCKILMLAILSVNFHSQKLMSIAEFYFFKPPTCMEMEIDSVENQGQLSLSVTHFASRVKTCFK